MYVPRTQKGLFANGLAWLLAAFAVATVLVLVGWRVGWWMNAKATNYQAHILRSSYANQQTLRDQITAQIGNVASITAQISETNDAGEKAALKAQRLAVAAIVCGDADQVTGDPLPTDQAQWVQENCAAGSVSPTSSFHD